MNIDGILDGKIIIEGQALPTLREIVEQHFVASAQGSVAIGKMISSQYLSYLTNMVQTFDARERASETADAQRQAQPGPEKGAEQPASGTGFRVGPDAEALLKSMGVPLTPEGRIDVMSTLAGVMTPEGSRTPLGTIVGAIMRGVGEPQKPRG